MPALKNARHERFAQGLAKGLSVKNAAREAGLNIALCERPEGYYVYILADSRTDAPFYIGKGVRLRYAQHVKDVLAGCTKSPLKVSRIKEILEAGGEVVSYCLQDDLDEGEAYALEREMIRRVGFDALTNSGLGGALTAIGRSKGRARALLRRLKPLEEWISERPRAQWEIDAFLAVKRELESVAVKGWPGEIIFTAHGPVYR